MTATRGRGCFPRRKRSSARPRNIVAGRGYRGHNALENRKFGLLLTEERRQMIESIDRELRRHAVVESVIGDLKSDVRMGRNFVTSRLAYRSADSGYFRAVARG